MRGLILEGVNVMRSVITIVTALFALVFNGGVPHPATAQTFEAPKYTKGTIFILLHTTTKGKTIHRGLIYKGATGSPGRRYDFGKYTLSKNLVYANKNSKTVRDRIPIKFPFSLGDSWKYQYVRENIQTDDCGTLTQSFEATVAKSMHKVTVAGTELNVVRIHHEGRWDCLNSGYDGRVTFDYEYSPQLGIYVSEVWKTYHSQGWIFREMQKNWSTT